MTPVMADLPSARRARIRPFGPNGANLNLILGAKAIDQVSAPPRTSHTYARFAAPPEAAHVTLPAMRERRILPWI